MTHRNLPAVLAVVGMVVFVFLVTHHDPRRPRPEGWNSGWQSLTLEPEATWASDPVRRDVLQELFSRASERLTHCTQESYAAERDDVLPLELLLEEVEGAMRF
jgi:hypothetical protein